MEPTEQYQMAAEILSKITSELNDGIYKQLNGSLTLKWDTGADIRAEASSKSSISDPPDHNILLSYKLVKCIFEDALHFCEFATTDLQDDLIKQEFDLTDHGLLSTSPQLPEIFSQSECVNIMFSCTLVWVYFHELGHLVQEHKYIFEQFGIIPNQKIQEVEENIPLTEENSAVRHHAEFAADCEAICLCIHQLCRCFSGKQLQGAIYMLITGLACLFCRFYSETETRGSKGTHPHPVFRMNKIIYYIIEILGDAVLESDKKVMASLYTVASSSGWLFVLWKSFSSVSDEQIAAFGIQENPDYINRLNNAWDKIDPTLLQLRRFPRESVVLKSRDLFCNMRMT